MADTPADTGASPVDSDGAAPTGPTFAPPTLVTTADGLRAAISEDALRAKAAAMTNADEQRALARAAERELRVRLSGGSQMAIQREGCRAPLRAALSDFLNEGGCCGLTT
jgi:uncharacterized protein YqfA (UPF0365 family)